MKHEKAVLIALGALLLGVLAGCGSEPEPVAGDWFYAIESKGVQAGYAVADTHRVVVAGDTLLQLEQRNHVESRLMGNDVTTDLRMQFMLRPTDLQVRQAEIHSVSGSQDLLWSATVEAGQVRSTSSLAQEELVLDLSPDAFLENTVFFPHVVHDVAAPDSAEAAYRIFDPIDRTIRDVHYRRIGAEVFEHAGEKIDVLVVERSVPEVGIESRMWIDSRTARLVKLLQKDVRITLADPSVVDRVQRVDADSEIFDPTNVAIADVTGLVYMKVRVRMRPIGLDPTPESLNVPGQKFTGTVENHVIEGVFEIEHPHWDGSGAPAFPIVESFADQSEYLGADGIFEADDPVLAAEARAITAGSADAWEATKRLAQWVHEEIHYAIPGGGTARRTYDIRAGECGAHSVLLATFCRAVGIPARMVWGCMYVPDKGGSFGQHGWTEVYMGQAGWIPVDATAGEVDYVDSGHIRVGHFASLVSRLNAEEFEILDYRVEGGGEAATRSAEQRYAAYLGAYRHPRSAAACTLRVMDGSLVVDLPGQAMLALHDPDATGRWVCKVAPHAFVTFEHKNQNATSDVIGFTFHETYSLPRRGGPEEMPKDVPDAVARLLGRYHFAALGADFEILWKRSHLLMRHPRVQRDFVLEQDEATGRWRARDGHYALTFVPEAPQDVESMTLEATDEFRKRQLVSSVHRSMP